MAIRFLMFSFWIMSFRVCLLIHLDICVSTILFFDIDLFWRLNFLTLFFNKWQRARFFFVNIIDTPWSFDILFVTLFEPQHTLNSMLNIFIKIYFLVEKSCAAFDFLSVGFDPTGYIFIVNLFDRYNS